MEEPVMLPYMPVFTAGLNKYRFNFSPSIDQSLNSQTKTLIFPQGHGKEGESMELEQIRSQLGVIRNICEEEDDDSCASRLPFVNSLSVPAGRNPDVIIQVHDSCFHLHKEALIQRSAYLKRHLTKFPEMMLSPPLNITPETFSLVRDFCYGKGVVLTQYNLAALRTAAELLDMSEKYGNGNLKQMTETYFISVVMVNKWHASIVLRSCFPLLPEAETAACLVSRCLHVLSLVAEDDIDLLCLDDFKSLAIDDLLVILESSCQRFEESHDLLYKIVDNYLKEKDEKLSEDQKIQICNYIDSSNLSTQTLIHAVQNPRMPLRFIFQLLFNQQRNNRQSIISAMGRRIRHGGIPITAVHQGLDMGDDVISATNSRIQKLEKKLIELRTGQFGEYNGMDGRGRSASFRFSSETNKVERNQNGSISFASDEKKQMREESWSRSAKPSDGDRTATAKCMFGRRLLRRLKNAICMGKKRGDMECVRLQC